MHATVRKERDHPRVPPEVGVFVARIACELRSLMIERYGDGRVIGWGAANRLLLVHACILRPVGDAIEQRRLDCLRDVLRREAERPRPEAIA